MDHLPAVSKKIRAVERMKKLLTSKDPAVVEKVRQANLAMVQRLLTPGAVHVDAAIANMSVQYKNEEYIGLSLMPMISVPKLSNRYFIYNKRDRLAVPDDNVGSRSIPNEVNETRSTSNYSCNPYALMDFIDDTTLQNEDAPLNEMVDLLASVNDAVDLREELRIAAKVQAAGNYPGQTTAYAAPVRWDSVGGGDPVANIQDARENCWTGNGATKLVGWCGIDVWKVLSRHPKILDVSKYTRQGFIKKDQFAEFFELDEMHIGRARQDTANIGQAANYGRVWGFNFGVMRVATNPGIRTASFGYTFRFNQKLTTQWYEAKPGVTGGYYGKVGLSEDHRIVASDTAYLLTTVIG